VLQTNSLHPLSKNSCFETMNTCLLLGALFQRAQLKLLNSTASIGSLRDAIRSLDLTNEARLRPSWDQYFMQLADLAALRSNCMKRRVGCCVVREKRVISTGYNGTPRGMTNCNEGGCTFSVLLSVQYTY
jgi:dCMP deaminase